MKHFDKIRGVIIYDFVDHKFLRRTLDHEGLRNEYVMDFVKPHATVLVVDEDRFEDLRAILEEIGVRWDFLLY